MHFYHRITDPVPLSKHIWPSVIIHFYDTILSRSYLTKQEIWCTQNYFCKVIYNNILTWPKDKCKMWNCVISVYLYHIDTNLFSRIKNGSSFRYPHNHCNRSFNWNKGSEINTILTRNIHLSWAWLHENIYDHLSW